MNRNRFEILDVFRGLFAFIVVLYHLKGNFSNTFMTHNRFISAGYLFVDFFFLLSGFVISYNYQSKIKDTNGFNEFLKKRFIRLYPLHFAMLMFSLFLVIFQLVFGLNHNSEVSANTTTFFTNLCLLQSIHFPNINSLSWNYPSWSISAEFISYIIFAILTGLTNRLKLPIIQYVWITVVLLAIIWSHSVFNQYVSFSTYNNGFIRGLIGFFLGVLCQNLFAKIEVKINHENKNSFTFFEFLAILGIVFFVSWSYLFNGMIIEAVFFFSVIIFSFERGMISKKLKQITILKEFGIISYSIYMVHPVVITVAHFLLKKIAPKAHSFELVAIVIILISVYFLSKWTYKNIEYGVKIAFANIKLRINFNARNFYS